ncbi:methyltransferase domain-containing protein [Candidatus Peregrinibacteria bacterium]|nr:methyltransferase domain-containing protein [Candidatus Peregrinibacteria bacterium]
MCKRKFMGVFNKIPINLKFPIKKLFYFGTYFHCLACNCRIRRFEPAGVDHEAVIKYQIIGGGFYSESLCPVCRSTYRDRLIMWYLKFKIDKKILKNGKIIHIAPEYTLYRYLKRNKNYYCGDIDLRKYPKFKQFVKIDIVDAAFDKNTFDLIICNHVLEHIPDDQKAMKEIYRILKPGGIAILQVPISKKLLTTYEDDTISEPDARQREFGQKDHVRIYGQDYPKRLLNAGLKVEIVVPANGFNYRKHGINKEERLFVCTK